jgi:hypothetical protein
MCLGGRTMVSLHVINFFHRHLHGSPSSGPSEQGSVTGISTLIITAMRMLVRPERRRLECAPLRQMPNALHSVADVAISDRCEFYHVARLDGLKVTSFCVDNPYQEIQQFAVKAVFYSRRNFLEKAEFLQPLEWSARSFVPVGLLV